MKNIISVAACIAVVTVIVLIAFSTSASATLLDRTFTQSGGTITYEGGFEGAPEDEKRILNVYRGEKIKFLGSGNKSIPVIISGPYTEEAEPGYYEEPCIEYDLEAGEEWDSEGKPTRGYFKVVNFSNNSEGGWFRLAKHSISVEIGGKKEKVQESENFSLRLKKNDRKQGVMMLTIEDDEGFSIMNVNGTDIYEILVAYKERDFVEFVANKSVEGISISERNLILETSKLDMREGEYKIILEDYATEADDYETIKVEERYLDVECDEGLVKGEDIVIVIRSSFFEEEVNVSVENFYYETLKLDEEGKKKVRISTEATDFGMHKVTVEVCGTKETKYVCVKKGELRLEEVPENATVGDVVHINGTSNFGNFAVLLVDDVFKNEARISDDEFEWNWDTIGELEGYKEIEVFIVNEHAPFSIGKRISEDWQKKEGVDASATIFLLPPRFSMTVQECIAEGDDVIISGEATGTDNVYIIVINSKGDVVFPPARIAKVTLVEEGEWEETLDELDRGRYVVISVHKGKDGETNAIKENGAWVAGSEGKTSEQRIEILTDALSSAGSDDLFEKTYFSVSTPKVSLKVPETVEIDEEINVTAETNIRECEKAFVSILLAQNSTIIKKTSAFVKNGGMNASINTSGLLPGIYNISVDIRERAHDEKEIILVEKREQEGEGEDEEESLTQNESLPESGSAEKANESVGTKDNEGGSKEISPKGYGGERKVLIPVNIWDLLIAIIVATSISIATRQRRR